MSRSATRGLDERGLAPQESFLVCVQNANERNLGKIETFTKQIDADQNVEIGRAQAAQNFHALDRVDVAMEIAHFQSDIAQIIGEIFGCAFRQRCNQNALSLFDPLAAKLDGIVDLMFERLKRNFRIQKPGWPNDLFHHERRARSVHIKFLWRLIRSREYDRDLACASTRCPTWSMRQTGSLCSRQHKRN